MVKSLNLIDMRENDRQNDMNRVEKMKRRRKII